MEYVLVIVLTPVLFLFSVFLNNRFLFPVLCAIPALNGYALGLKSSIVEAFALILLWTLIQTTMVLVLSARFPEKMRHLILKSETYTNSMFRWIETGALPEGSSIQVLLSHLRQSIIYCFLALISGNTISLLFGCILLNYMNYYVSQLSNRSSAPAKTVFLGWNFWSIIRVLAFLWLGVVLGIPIASLVVNSSVEFQWVWLIPGIAGIILDVVLKLTLSEPWRRKLSRLIIRTE